MLGFICTLEQAFVWDNLAFFIIPTVIFKIILALDNTYK